jgi:uncharacterized protein
MGRVRIHVTPRARRTELLGRHGEGWRARVAAPPERGRANAALAELLAEVLGVPRADVRVVAGHASRDKVVEIDGLAGDEVERRLESAGP